MQIVLINAMWCPGCIVMHKIWNNIEKKYTDIEFIKYDFDLDEEVVKSFNPGDILPITIIMKDNKELTRLIGEKKEQEIIDAIEEFR